MKIKIVSCHTADSKPVKQEVNGTVILPPLVLPAKTYIEIHLCLYKILSNFGQFCNFSLYSKILDSFKHYQFQIHNTKA
jgi:hypothetical protein